MCPDEKNRQKSVQLVFLWNYEVFLRIMTKQTHISICSPPMKCEMTPNGRCRFVIHVFESHRRDFATRTFAVSVAVVSGRWWIIK